MDYTGLTLASPPTAYMGNFRLLVLATRLLEMALENVSQRDVPTQAPLSNTQQLYRTLCAFAAALEIEGESNVTIGGPRSIINRLVIVLRLYMVAVDAAEAQFLSFSQTQIIRMNRC